MKPNKICKGSFIMAMAVVAAFTLAAVWPCAAAPKDPKECSLVGTWYGDAGSPLSWLGIHTAGKDDKNGEMLMNWVRVKNSLVSFQGMFTTATRLTGGHGVWEQSRKNQYKYTWYAYGIDASGQPVYSVRVSGLATITDCDNVTINFTYDVFAGLVLPQDMSGAVPVGNITDVAFETRVPLTP
jgi:hypothetical protein